MDKKVVVFTSTTCPHCVTAKEYLAQKGVEYEEKNVQSDVSARKELMAKGIMAVPVIKIGDEMIVGVDKAKIDSLLD
ncbi:MULTISPECIES: glutaredoxin family protein [Anoxynatronum]|uniref:Glutaredoxin-like protein, YruB-family n=2 Tax=Anoxynatronum TaxID=210622 RepID=A0AA46AJK2_9CLOT|nr:glutaredoxin family protein [Anoxynatronum buryatiense]SMP61170.1 Glutaredoxin-like protein, YruB-family [Anoxynatronum buryatiense]